MTKTIYFKQFELIATCPIHLTGRCCCTSVSSTESEIAQIESREKNPRFRGNNASSSRTGKLIKGSDSQKYTDQIERQAKR